MTEHTSVDIAVVGGGLVGTPLAIVLSQLGFSVALIDKQSLTDPAPESGSRGFTAVSDSTVRTLKKHRLLGCGGTRCVRNKTSACQS